MPHGSGAGPLQPPTAAPPTARRRARPEAPAHAGHHRESRQPGTRPTGASAAGAGLGIGQTRRTALLLPDGLSFSAWSQLGHRLHRLADSAAWWAGDWLVYGSTAFPDRYRQAAEATALDYQTLRNYAWVARKVEVGRRRAELSFQHHQEVAALAPDDQDHWLGQAAEHGWSKAELRHRLRAVNGSASSRPRPSTRLLLDVDGERWGKWQRAAAAEDGDVAAWLRRLADRAADASH
ncbi:LmbU family transcriptional regulator [Streptomyces sp. NPDC091972]|uniref:LmbU family transcriptional regulator n=1 Tax=unclassified Streptomyces TaxID=2593676 RepID=UPI00342A6BCD